MTSGQANYRTTSSGAYVVIDYWWENIISEPSKIFDDAWETELYLKNLRIIFSRSY